MGIKKKIALVGGARPNFMKIAPIYRALKEVGAPFFVVNTGQHFSKNMADDFIKEFGITIDYNLKPSQDSVVKQFADIMVKLEKVFEKERPTLIVVVGDVNSTLAATLVGRKMGIKVAHVEAGLRSYNKVMQEEVNRVLTDRLSDLLFATSEDAVENLKKEGIVENVHVTGNVMIDTLAHHLGSVEDSDEKYYLCTLHRPENVDSKEVFSEILDALETISKDAKIYLPLHPRTEKMAKKYRLIRKMEKIFNIIPPLSYIQSVQFQKNATLILTDSGGIQEEASYIGTPCLTLRDETERPITVTHGTNTIAGTSKASILEAYKNKRLDKNPAKIPLWDGMAAKRIVEIILLN